LKTAKPLIAFQYFIEKPKKVRSKKRKKKENLNQWEQQRKRRDYAWERLVSKKI